MRKKYKTIKTLAAFTALASSATPLYSHAEVKSLPSIELNFDVLEKLQKQEVTRNAEKVSVKPVPELEDSERLVKPALKPEPVAIAKPVAAEKDNTKKIAESEHKAEKDSTIPTSLPAHDSVAQPDVAASNNSNPPIIIQKDIADDTTNAPKTEKKGAVSSFFDKFVSKKPENAEALKPQTATETVAQDAAQVPDVKEDKSVVSTEKKAKPVEKNKKKEVKKKKEPAKKTSVDSKKVAKKHKETVKKKAVTPEKPKVKEETATIVKVPDSKPQETPAKQQVPEVKNTETLSSSSVSHEAPAKVSAVQEEPKTEVVKPDAIKAETPAKETTPVEAKEETKGSSAWQFFLKETQKKSDAASELADNQNKTDENANSLIFANKPSEVMLVTKKPAEKPEAPKNDKSEKPSVSQPEKIVEPTAKPVKPSVEAKEKIAAVTEVAPKVVVPDKIEKSGNTVEKQEVDRSVVENAPVEEALSTKPAKGYFSSFMDKMSALGGAKNTTATQPKQEETTTGQGATVPQALPEVSDSVPESSTLEEEMAKSKEILDEKSKSSVDEVANKARQLDNDTEKKLGDAIDNKIAAKPAGSIPPVPEPAEIPMQMSALTPPGDAAPVTLKDVDKNPKPAATDENTILLSITFDGNNVVLNKTEKDKLNKLVQQMLSSGKRLKVMSYASGIDGEVNSARRISLQRAIAIRTQMIEDGLEKTRINVQAIGNNTADHQFANSVNIYATE